MMPAIGIVVIDRLELMRQARRSGVLAKRTPAVALPAEEVFHHYRGFDGQIWPTLERRPFSTDGGLAAPSDWAAVSVTSIATSGACEEEFGGGRAQRGASDERRCNIAARCAPIQHGWGQHQPILLRTRPFHRIHSVSTRVPLRGQ